ncbi:hypothetical protein BgiMline_021903, partial [Biomphalaria glabrata]
ESSCVALPDTEMENMETIFNLRTKQFKSSRLQIMRHQGLRHINRNFLSVSNHATSRYITYDT